MRILVVLTAIMGVWTTAAPAQSWKEYEYPDSGFAVSFPDAPATETLPFKAPDGTMVTETVYSVRQAPDIYSVTVADFSNASVDEPSAIDQAVRQLQEKGEIRINIPARVNRHFGRQLSIIGQDGSHSTVAIFFADHRLYQIQGTVLPESDDPNSGNAIRFQQSLRFTGDNGGGRFGQGGGGRRFRGGRPNRNEPNPTPDTQTP